MASATNGDQEFTGVGAGESRGVNYATSGRVLQEQRRREEEAAARQREEQRDGSDGSDDGADEIPTDLKLAEDTVALYNTNARRVLLRCAIAQVAAGAVMLLCFWAAYGWTIVVAFLAVGMGVIGYSHYQSADSVATNACCCRPVSFIHQQTYLHLTLAVLAFISVVTSIAAAVVQHLTVAKVFAGIAAAASVVIMAVSIASHVFSQQLVKFCVAAQADQDLGNPNVIMVQPRRASGHPQPTVGRPLPDNNPFAAGHAGAGAAYPPAAYDGRGGPQPFGHASPNGHGSAQGYGTPRPPGVQHHQPPPPPGYSGYGYGQAASYGYGGFAPGPSDASSPVAGPSSASAASHVGGRGDVPQPAERTAMIAPAGTAIAPVQPPGLPPGAFVVYPIAHGDPARGPGAASAGGGDDDCDVPVPAAAAEEHPQGDAAAATIRAVDDTVDPEQVALEDV